MLNTKNRKSNHKKGGGESCKSLVNTTGSVVNISEAYVIPLLANIFLIIGVFR